MNNATSPSPFEDCIKCVRKVGPRPSRTDLIPRIPILIEQRNFGSNSTYDFILDSGANISLIPSHLAGRLGIDPNVGDIRKVHGAGGSTHMRCRELRVRLPGPIPTRLIFGFPPPGFVEDCILSAWQLAGEQRIVLCGDGVCFRPITGRRDQRRSPRLRVDGWTAKSRALGGSVDVAELSAYGVLVGTDKRKWAFVKGKVTIASKEVTFTEDVVASELIRVGERHYHLLVIDNPTPAFAGELDTMYSAALLGSGDVEIVGREPVC
jgi:hypothetical protein